jgi:hypothetical protein
MPRSCSGPWRDAAQAIEPGPVGARPLMGKGNNNLSIVILV